MSLLLLFGGVGTAAPALSRRPPLRLPYKAQRRPLWKFFRPKHVIFPPVKPAGFIPWHRSLLRFNSRRPLKSAYRSLRIKRAYPIFVSTPPVGFVARPNKLRKVRRRRPYPLRHRVYLFPGAAAAPQMVLQRVWRIYLRR